MTRTWVAPAAMATTTPIASRKSSILVENLGERCTHQMRSDGAQMDNLVLEQGEKRDGGQRLLGLGFHRRIRASFLARVFLLVVFPIPVDSRKKTALGWRGAFVGCRAIIRLAFHFLSVWGNRRCRHDCGESITSYDGEFMETAVAVEGDSRLPKKERTVQGYAPDGEDCDQHTDAHGK